jgi:tRNA pseudouridine55 synthase
MNGVLVVDKPKGVTSFDVVREVRRAMRIKKVGHTGTLDPMATGVLPVCIGDATKIAQFITDATKSYDAVVRLGATTDTLDAEGKVLVQTPVPALELTMVDRVLDAFRGTFLQTPPMYSAVKVGGRRLYELARAGEEVERSPREVTVSSLQLVDLTATDITLRVTSSKGFFVRVLASEIGAALGCGAHLVALRRTRSGPFSLAQATPLQEVLDHPGDVAQKLISMAESLVELSALTVSAMHAERVRHGGLVEMPPTAQGLFRVVTAEGELLAIAEASRGKLVYRRVLARDE